MLWMRHMLAAAAGWWLARRLPSDLDSGDICVVSSADKGSRIVKVLRVDDSTVHVALYQNTFSKRPAHVDTNGLDIGRIDDEGIHGIGHLPLSRGTFAAWLPVRIQRSEVTDEELVGYRIWEESKGGTFG
jgi:hypothetical protein